VEQRSNGTANDRECYYFTPETEDTLVHSVIAVTRVYGSEVRTIICAL